MKSRKNSWEPGNEGLGQTPPTLDGVINRSCNLQQAMKHKIQRLYQFRNWNGKCFEHVNNQLDFSAPKQ
jgi:hypothetical protein